jgi:hypothetical protein
MIIDDLLENADQLVPDGQSPTVAFYHFSITDQWSIRTPEAALRAIAAQIIAANKTDKLTIDALSLIRQETGSKQSCASTEDLIALLGILLRRHPTFIVIDGIDECDGSDRHLDHLFNIGSSHDVRLVLLSRPSIDWMSSSLSHSVSSLQSRVLSLTASLTIKDIENFLTLHLKRLVEADAVGDLEEDELKQKVEDLALRANGMFLWARLLVNLLYSAALTPRARLEILAEPGPLQGIDNLYNRILSTISQQSAYERAVVQDIIMWVAGSIYPLCTASMRTGLAIIPGQKTSSTQLLNKFPECVPSITCALVEIAQYGYLSFIHLSFKEYLARRYGNTAAVDIHIARKCLSYLVYDVPAKPLRRLIPPIDQPYQAWQYAGGARTSVEASTETQNRIHEAFGANDSEKVTKSYPLLRYSAANWSLHLWRALDLGMNLSVAMLQFVDASDNGFGIN